MYSLEGILVSPGRWVCIVGVCNQCKALAIEIRCTAGGPKPFCCEHHILGESDNPDTGSLRSRGAAQQIVSVCPSSLITDNSEGMEGVESLTPEPSYGTPSKSFRMLDVHSSGSLRRRFQIEITETLFESADSSGGDRIKRPVRTPGCKGVGRMAALEIVSEKTEGLSPADRDGL